EGGRRVEAVRIGIVPVLDRSWGGMYQYSVSFVLGLSELGLDDEFVVFASHDVPVPDEIRAGPYEVAIMPEFDRLRAVRRMFGKALPPSVISWLARIAHASRGRDTTAGRAKLLATDTAWREWFARFEVDLLVFTVESDIAFRTGLPYVVSIHDLQHRQQPGLPEFSHESDWERREYRMRNSIANAAVVLVDSDMGKQDLLEHYGDTGIDPEYVMPFRSSPAHYLSAVPTDAEIAAVRKRYSLPDRYLFYPAQFWPHKNHRRIIEALGLLADDGMRPHLVLAGSASGRLRHQTFLDVMRTASHLGVAEQVHYLGYVPDDDMKALYSRAETLVMPTFFGTTNIPVIEAWHFDCPVVTSDLRGLREQVDGAAVLVDPSSAPSIADGIRQVVSDEDLRKDLIRRGREQIATYTHDDYLVRLGEVLEAAKRRTSEARGLSGRPAS
ncbi:MAG TPA: glycosyltransferase family 1 protein, partial [Coriobacteriia bacterium]|nr:glycosyltransferase family 1 protein [Coriobacteriia bacterium]